MPKSLVRRGVAVTVAAAVAALGAVVVAAPAQAAVSLTAVSLSANTVVLDGNAGCGDRFKVSVKVYDPQSNEDELFDVSADVIAPNGDTADYVWLALAYRSGDYAYYTDYVSVCGWDSPGSYRVRAQVEWFDSDYETHRAEKTATFAVKRPTSLTYNAAPEPVKKNALLTHAGVLKFDPWGYGDPYGKSGVTLKFYFKSSAAKAYTYKGSVTTGKGGKYSKKLKATATGTWKVVYAGAGTQQGQTKYDTVKIK